MNNGWVKLFRSMNEWEWSRHPLVVAMFVHLVLDANHEDKQWHGVNVARGSLATSVAKLSLKTGLSNQQTRTVLSKLKSTNDITIVSNKQFTLITVNNYSKYQGSTNDATQSQQSINKQPNTKITTTKEIKKKEIEKINKKEISTPASKYPTPDHITRDDLIAIARQHDVSLEVVSNNLQKIRVKLQQGDKKVVNLKNFYLALVNWVLNAKSYAIADGKTLPRFDYKTTPSQPTVNPEMETKLEAEAVRMREFNRRKLGLKIDAGLLPVKSTGE